MKKRTLITVISVALIACLAVVGTFAYITNVQDAIKNVFTIGNVDVTLKEEGGEPDPDNPGNNNFVLVPNTTMTKDATITVGKTSSSAYIFAVVAEKCTAALSEPVKAYKFSDYVDYSLNSTDGWSKLDGYNNVYYLKYEKPDEEPEEETVYHLITDTDEDDKGDITVKDLDDNQIKAAEGADISLSFQAGAVQAEGLEGETEAEKVLAAWAAIEEKFTVDTGKVTK